MDLQQELTARFFRYLAISSQSRAAEKQVPSSEGQWQLARLLAEELIFLGLQDVAIDEHANVTALLKGAVENATPIGFVAHLDTVDVALSPYISPQIKTFDGADILLNEKENIWLKVAEHPEILPYLHQDIIFSDGTSVLGADNKAAIANIMTALSLIKTQHIPTGDVYIAFVPDEEIGLRGAKLLDLTRFKPDFAYTIDCCELGEVVYENFNAAAATVTIQGVTAHPMSAKGVLLNPILVAQDLIALFDREQRRNAPNISRVIGGLTALRRITVKQLYKLPFVILTKPPLNNAKSLSNRQYTRFSSVIRAPVWNVALPIFTVILPTP